MNYNGATMKKTFKLGINNYNNVRQQRINTNKTLDNIRKIIDYANSDYVSQTNINEA